MGVIDRLFGKQLKKATLEQAEQLAGQAMDHLKTQIGAYYGGYSGYNNFYGSDSGGSKYPYGLSSDGRTRLISHFRLRQNARDAYHESMDARGIVDRFADTTADTGLVANSTPVYEILGITPEEAETWGDNVDRRFHLWCMDKKQHRPGLMNFYQSQHLYAKMQHRDNDIFSRLYYTKKAMLQSPLQFDFIDANQIRGYAWTSTYAQYATSDGIERNADGSEKAYKVWINDPGKQGAYKQLTIPRIGEKSKRIMMLHGFNPEYAGQSRGYSRLGFALQEFENITDLSLATIKKAINQSNMVFTVENQQKDPGNPLADIANDIQSAVGGISPEAQEVVNNLTNSIEICPLPEAAFDNPGSTAFVNNEQGDNIKLLQNTTPAESFGDFVMAFSERLASAAGIPIEVVLMKFGQNYSASRATLVLFWRVVQMWRDEMAADYLNPMREMWLAEEIAAGRISAPGWADPVLRAAWLSCQWIGSPIPSIDPAKEAKAKKDNLEMNLTTLERESRNLNGSDARSNIEKNKKLFPEIATPPWAKSGSKSDKSITEESDDGESRGNK